MKCKCCQKKVTLCSQLDCKYCLNNFCIKCICPLFHNCSNLKQYEIEKRSDLFDFKTTVSHNFEKM